LGNDVAIAAVTPEKLKQAGGYRYKKARRPDLYGHIINQTHEPEQNVVWMQKTST